MFYQIKMFVWFISCIFFVGVRFYTISIEWGVPFNININNSFKPSVLMTKKLNKMKILDDFNMLSKISLIFDVNIERNILLRKEQIWAIWESRHCQEVYNGIKSYTVLSIGLGIGKSPTTKEAAYNLYWFSILLNTWFGHLAASWTASNC